LKDRVETAGEFVLRGLVISVDLSVARHATADWRKLL
jgi:hypothetical protein